MRPVFTSLFCGLIAAVLFAAAQACAQQTPENFRWIDFHGPSGADHDIVTWVTRSLVVEDWTAIREIGVEYDAALVITTKRAIPQSPPETDSFTVWSASLTTHDRTPLLRGTNLRLLDWLLVADGQPREMGALYDDCRECAATTFFTAFHYDFSQHMWAARWRRGSQTAPVWSANLAPGLDLTQVYALLTEPNGRQWMGTWNHIDRGLSDRGKAKSEDSLFRYDLDPFSNLERTELLSGKEAELEKQRLCQAQAAAPELARGQDSLLCQQIVKPRPERRPVTTPPENNHGRSQPPGARR